MRRRTNVVLLVTYLAAVFVVCRVARVPAQAPAATVTAVNPRTGVVTAKINTTGQVFTFTLANRGLVAGVHPGQGVFVNLGKKQVSLDGKQAQGTILALLPAARVPIGAPSGSSASSGSGNSGTSTSSGTPAPVVLSCGGSTNPLSADNCGKVGSVATETGLTATCGASATITGNVFPAGTEDWLTFAVPASRASCANPMVQVSLSSSAPGAIVFDVLASPNPNDARFDSLHGTSAIDVMGVAGFGSQSTAPPPGTYYIRVHATPGTVGTWTLQIKG